MGSGPSQSSTTNPVIPKQLQPLIGASANTWLAGLQAAGGPAGLAQLLQPNPQQVAPLTGGEATDISGLQSLANNPQITSQEQQAQGTFSNLTGGLNAQEQQSQALIDQLTGGAIGSSPATLAAMRAYQQNVAPTIANDVALSGGGRGGALASALSQGETNAYVPLIQQEIANREAGVGQLASLGGQLANQQTTGATDLASLGNTLAQRQATNLQTALQASGLPRTIQDATNQAAYQDFL